MFVHYSKCRICEKECRCDPPRLPPNDGVGEQRWYGVRCAWPDVEERLFCSPECLKKFLEAEVANRDKNRKFWQEHTARIVAKLKESA
jgi:hypothetical protein